MRYDNGYLAAGMTFADTIGNVRYTFGSLRELLARATPLRSGDVLAGVVAQTAEERVAAQFALADVPLEHFLFEHVVPYEDDEVTRLIADTHDAAAFAPIRSFTVGELRDWLLSDEATAERVAALGPGLTPEMAAAVSKIMRVQDLILAAAKIRVVTHFRTTVGLPGRLSARLQPNHPTDDAVGIAASILDGLLLGSGDAERNCISNIRTEGLSYREAAEQLVNCLGTARRRRLTGTALGAGKNLLQVEERLAGGQQ